MKNEKKGWGFDTRDIDAEIRPQDDFYTYANGTWLRNNPIPETESRWGSFTMLRFDTEKRLKSILAELEDTRRLPAGSPEQMIRDFYRSGMDMKKRTERGLAPLKEYRARIQAISSKEDLLAVVASLHELGIGVLWGPGVDQDMKDSESYILYIGQDGLGMPDREYYLNDDAESKRVRDAYVVHLKAMLKLMGRKPAEAEEQTVSIMGIETALARASMKKEDSRDPEKVYHKFTPTKLRKLAPRIDWTRYLKLIGAKDIRSLIVMQPAFLEESERLIETVPLDAWKTYLDFHLVNEFASYLPLPFVRQIFSFYGTTLSGTKKMKPLWRQALSTVNGHVGELFGRIYVKKHFSPEAKKAALRMVKDLLTAYEARIKQLDWMTPATKKKAVAKLHAMTLKLGYPDKWKSYKGLVIKADDYAGNVIRTSEFEHRRAMRRLTQKVDRKEWFMYPQTVNAYYCATLNDIVFPAAILQPPFFDIQADAGINYGSMGMVIGHEITHGFDDEGSKFDGTGNLKSWWSAEDRKRFEKKTDSVEKQFSEYTVDDGVPVNGKLTLGENIADLGGLSIALDAYKLELARSGRCDIDGFTPEQRFFLGYTLFERENARPEFTKTQVLTDPHAPPIFRINGAVANLPEFYDAFGVKKGDKLYRDPSKRAKVW